MVVSRIYKYATGAEKEQIIHAVNCMTECTLLQKQSTLFPLSRLTHESRNPPTNKQRETYQKIFWLYYAAHDRGTNLRRWLTALLTPRPRASPPVAPLSRNTMSPQIAQVVKETIDSLDRELREISLKVTFS